MRRSPLNDIHSELGARFVEFSGWEMPLQYESVLAEHRAVRGSCGAFDVTHLGRFSLVGPGAQAAVSRLLCNDLERIAPGRCQYTMMLNAEGGIVDDIIVWWWHQGGFWIMPNAANHARVMAAFAQEEGCAVTDLREETVFLAVQGPEAPGVLEAVLGAAPARMRNLEASWEGSTVHLAGTGYTGERGAELCTDPVTGEGLFRALIDEGAVPCGLGARDTLRLEAGLNLWGQDTDEATTPLEAGLDFAVSYGHDFVGKEALERQRAEGITRRLAGFILEGKGIPRHGNAVRTSTGGEGVVTSGNLSPLIKTGVGLAYIAPPPEGDEAVEVNIRDRWVPGRLATPPFHEAR